MFLLVSCITSCSHKDLDFPEGDSQFNVSFDWSNAPDAQPDGMLLTLFSGNSQPVSFHLSDRSGGSLTVPTATYGMVAYNDNTENLLTRGSSWESFEIYSAPLNLAAFSQMFASSRANNIPMAPGTEDQLIISEPDLLWTSAKNAVNTKNNGTVTMVMRTATIIFPFAITGVENIDRITDIAGSISGMSGSCYPALAKTSAPNCVIPFELKSDGKGTVYGQVRTFGHSDDEAADTRHVFVIYFQLNDNTKYYVSVDVTDDLHKWHKLHPDGSGENPDGTPTVEPIEIKDFSVPEPMGEDSGLKPSVDEWKEVDIGIRM